MIINILPNYPITQLPNYPITQLPNYPITQLPNYPITQLPKLGKIFITEKMKKKIDIRKLNVTVFKKFFIIAISVLIVADIIFLLADDYATISKVVLYATPKYLVFIWLFGMLTTHFFFPREKSDIRMQRGTRFMITALIAVILFIVGHVLDKEVACNDVDFPALKEKPFYIELSCREYRENVRLDCATLNCQKQSNSNAYVLDSDENGEFLLKYDITQEMKLLLMVFGFISGYFIWPQTIEKKTVIENES